MIEAGPEPIFYITIIVYYYNYNILYYYYRAMRAQQALPFQLNVLEAEPEPIL